EGQLEAARSVVAEAHKLQAACEEMVNYWGSEDPLVVRSALANLDIAEKSFREKLGSCAWVDAWSWEDIEKIVHAPQEPGSESEGLNAVKRELLIAKAVASSVEGLVTVLGTRLASLCSQDVDLSA
ncbi:MAG: hypothetical protein MK135_16795, partial [Polyangiaceae bacterium]|nr:hypothetical protein [Polyangiaceae bacterium]